MKETHEIKTTFEVILNHAGLTPGEQSLISAAIKATENAYAPYSKFNVGASLLLDNQEIITGSNQENAVFPLGLCAERVALFNYGNKNTRVKIEAIAVATQSKFKVDSPVFPCGSCRHVILEFEKRQKRDIAVLVVSNDGKVYKIKTVKDILPFAFEGDFLK